MKSIRVLLGLLTSVAAGAVLGILFAPEKGSKTRKQILTKTEDYGDVIKGKLDTFLDGVEDKFDKTKQKAEQLVEEGKAKVENARRDGKHIPA